MTTLTRQQVEELIKKAPKGTDPEKVVMGILDRGYEIEGLNPAPSKAVEPERTLGDKAGSALTTVLGGKQIGEAIGKTFSKNQFENSEEGRRLAQSDPEAYQQILDTTFKRPGFKQLAGDVLRTASTFIPVGKIASGVAKGAKALGIGSTVAKTVGGATAGGVVGASADIGEDLSEGRAPTLGLGTALGVGIPVASPIIGAISRASAKVAGRGISEVQGALTGTSAETIEQAFNAARTGGDDLVQYTNALRGKTTPEKLVNTVRENIGTISSQRQALFKETLAELGDTVVNTAPAKSSFLSKLQEAGVQVSDNGLLDFSNSKLKLVPAAQTKIQTAWQEVSNLPIQSDLASIDTTRQALKALSLSGDDPSANLANKLLDDAVRGVRTTGEQVEGYGTMLNNFAETSEFLDELERGLSAGDRATVDQAYRRMATALKTNNEQRAVLIKELDEATDGAILSTIAGQQLSEALPRGLFRQIAAGIAGAGIVSGGISSSMIPALVFASPRVTGEFVRALGLTAKQADIIITAINDARGVLVKAGAIAGAEVDDSGNDSVEEGTD